MHFKSSTFKMQRSVVFAYCYIVSLWTASRTCDQNSNRNHPSTYWKSIFYLGFVNHSIFVALVFSFGYTLLWRTVCRGNRNPILATDSIVDLSKVNSINSGYLPGILVLCRSNISAKKLSLTPVLTKKWIQNCGEFINKLEQVLFVLW